MLSAVSQPLYALADSRLLFGRNRDGSLFLKSMIERPGVVCPRVAYVGASNADGLEYYHDIFEPAMQEIRSCQCRMILTRPLPEEGNFLQKAEVIVLAGGSVETGWRAFVQNGFRELILRRFYEGVTLIGVSAGAVQLGQGGLTEEGTTLLKTFGLLPFYVSVHEEKQEWECLYKTLAMAPEPARGIGIPSGAGLIYQAGEVEPVGHSLQEIVIESGPARENVLFPRSW